MAKLHTAEQHDVELADTQRVKDYLKGIRKACEEDENDRQDWLQKRAHYQRRRYSLEWRSPTYPWPGSSEIVMPLIDKKIDELKPEFVNLVLASKPAVTALALSQDIRNETGVELWADWLVKWGIPGYAQEVILASDDFLEIGRAIVQTSWLWKTQHAPEVLTLDRLPERLRQLVVVDISAKRADRLFALAQQQGVPSPKILTRREFEQIREQIARIVQIEFQLDPEEPVDQGSIDKILDWLQAGAEEPLTFFKRDVVHDVPAMTTVSPIDFVVPESTTDIESAERMTHKMYFNRAQLLRRARDGGWDMTAVKFVTTEDDKKIQRGNRPFHSRRFLEYELDQADREGTARSMDQEIEVHQTCSWYTDRAGIPDRKVVVLYSPLHPDKPFKFFFWHRPSGKWPYHTATLELNKRRWYSPRGIPEIIDDLEAEITFEHRAKLNRMTIANSPSFAYRVDSHIRPENFKWVPGQFYPMRNPQVDLVPMQIPNLDVSFEREEQILRTWAEERLGGVDFGLANPLSSLTEARTAREIGAIQDRSRRSLSLRGTLWQKMFQEVYHEMFDLWTVFGPPEVWINVTGGEPIRLTKEELQGQFIFQLTGTIGERDPVLETQTALARLQTLIQIASLGIIPPEFDLNMGVALQDWLEKSDARLARRILRIRSLQEVQQIQAEQQRKAELVQAAQANVPLSLPDLQEAMKEIEKNAPNKRRQQVAV